MLLQNQNSLSNFSQQDGESEPTDAAADDDRVEVLWDFTGHKTYRRDKENMPNRNRFFVLIFIYPLFWEEKKKKKIEDFSCDVKVLN